MKLNARQADAAKPYKLADDNKAIVGRLNHMFGFTYLQDGYLPTVFNEQSFIGD